MKREPEHIKRAREATRKHKAEANGKPAKNITPPAQQPDEYPPDQRGDAYDCPPAAAKNGKPDFYPRNPDADDAPGYSTAPSAESSPPPAAEAPPLVIARPASAFMATPVDWLWSGRIPCGALTIFDGDPGLGKSTITLDLTARVSRGYAMPPGSGASNTVPANVVILSAEDDPARTIRPRLEAAGADLERVQIVEGIAVGDGDRLPILPYDLVALEDFVARHSARLVIVDPLMAFLGDGIESHKDQSIRLALRQFAKLAERVQCALLVVRHLNKLTGGSALYRGGGSIGIIGAARSGLLLAKHPDDPTSRVLASVKSNLGPPPRSIVVSLVSAGPVAVAAWGAEIDMSADDLLGQPTGNRRSKVDECAVVIAELLADGQRKSADLDAELEARGYKERTIKSARRQAGAKARKSSYDGEWYVTL